MLSRRELLQTASSAGIAAYVASYQPLAHAAQAQPAGVLVNDRQSQLNETRVARVEEPKSQGDVQAALAKAAKENNSVSLCGGRHAMGGQQFGADTVLIDTSKLNRVLEFDREKRLITAQAGIQWPELLDYLHSAQKDDKQQLSIRQKQTGVDQVSLGGTLGANAHGRGLRFPPIVGDVESFVLVDAAGKAHQCSRTENSELFSLAIGGYGLFGVVTEVTLRLVPRQKVERIVKLLPIQDLIESVDTRAKDGFLYGDCQYNTSVDGDEPHQGVFSCYRPVDDATPIPENQKHLSADDWGKLLYLGHTNRHAAFRFYSDHYLATSGQIYWSDTHQMGVKFGDYHKPLDKALGAKSPGTEMISEIYVRPDQVLGFLAGAKEDCRKHDIRLIYGTIRFIEPDEVSFLRWAKERQVCVLCNLHIDHTPDGLAKAQRDFRTLFSRAIAMGGRYFLTYHRYATREQVLAAYPQIIDFLKLKRKYDPRERIQSTWYRHYREMFADRL